MLMCNSTADISRYSRFNSRVSSVISDHGVSARHGNILQNVFVVALVVVIASLSVAFVGADVNVVLGVLVGMVFGDVLGVVVYVVVGVVVVLVFALGSTVVVDVCMDVFVDVCLHVLWLTSLSLLLLGRGG